MSDNRGPRVNLHYNTYKQNELVKENSFINMPQQQEDLPLFEDSRNLLPEPYWENHQSAIDCYWRTWELAFSNLRKVDPQSGFVANYIDTAFNDCIFMWDSCFILMFGRYGTRAFDFLRTLDNFYCKQHPDGFICREIGQTLGDDRFHRFDPTSTGPDIMPWTEWEYYLNFGDRERLERVFPVLRVFHQWMRDYRTWPDGSYWASGWACGMDNQPRLGTGVPFDAEMFYHEHMVWSDTCFQQILSAQILVEIARVIGRTADVEDMQSEIEHLTGYVNDKLWDDTDRFYYDLRKDGTLNGVKNIGPYWALLADVVPEDKAEAFISHLDDPNEFNRPHRCPSLSADHPDYDPEGGYWKGSVWPPTNYMLLRGLTKYGRDKLAYEIAKNHLDAVVKVFEDTGSVYENYAPEKISTSNAGRRDFVGWGGGPPICVLLEYVIGIKADVPAKKIVWDVNLLEAHGVSRYPFGPDGILDLRCEARTFGSDKPKIKVTSNVPVDIEIRWPGGSEILHIEDRD